MNVSALCPGKLTFETHAFAESALIQTFTAVLIPQFVRFTGLNCRKSLLLDAFIPSSTEMFSVSGFSSEGGNLWRPVLVKIILILFLYVLIIILGVALIFASVQFFSGLLYFHIGASNLFLVPWCIAAIYFWFHDALQLFIFWFHDALQHG